MDAAPTLYVCHGDDGGPRVHPCRRVQEALRAAGIEYREELRAATGDTKLPALKLADGTVMTQSRAILSWIKQRSGAASA
jgi:glutathione S-transferase